MATLKLQIKTEQTESRNIELPYFCRFGGLVFFAVYADRTIKVDKYSDQMAIQINQSHLYHAGTIAKSDQISEAEFQRAFIKATEAIAAEAAKIVQQYKTESHV